MTKNNDEREGFVELLIENGMKFDKSKLNVYFSRDLLPAPAVYIAGKPYWYKSQIMKYIQINKKAETKTK